MSDDTGADSYAGGLPMGGNCCLPCHIAEQEAADRRREANAERRQSTGTCSTCGGATLNGLCPADGWDEPSERTLAGAVALRLLLDRLRPGEG